MIQPSLTPPGRPQPVDRCAWYLRISTPKQKLEHQREHVYRFCQDSDIRIPTEMQFEDAEKRHKSAKRQAFQRLLNVVRAGQVDWIIICSFDRWGVADVDEFFEFRRLLLKHDVQLWSVVDQMNLTGINEGDYFRVVAMAIGATRYVEQMAEKNILKMIEMAKQGWAASGNAPFGTDLVCYPLHDLSKPLFRVVRMRYIRPHLYRTVTYTPDSRVERNDDGIITSSHLTVAKEEIAERMPLRDKKATGYRIEPSIETDRLRGLNLMFELYDSGMGFREISRSLWGQGLQHYDKPFAFHGIETILDNPAYVGRPAWGKVGVGAYRILHNGGPAKIKRRASDTLVVHKDESQFVQPLKPLFLPIVPVDLWERVHARLKDRVHSNPDYGKRRTRNKATHPLNGMLFCPDCGERMVLGSSMPAAGSRGKKVRVFNCGTYRRFGRLKCHANTLSWSHLDNAIEVLLHTVKDRIGSFIADPVKALKEEEWCRENELSKVMKSITDDLVNNGDREAQDELWKPPRSPDVPIITLMCEIYNGMHTRRTHALRQELGSIDKELTRIGELLMENIPSQTIKKQMYERIAKLEGQKKEIEPLLVPMSARAETLIEQLQAIERAIEANTQLTRARLLESFIDRVIPRFDVKCTGPNRKRRAVLRSVEFIPRKTGAARTILPEPMEVGATHRGTDSSRPPG